MRFVRFEKGKKNAYGLVKGETITEIKPSPFETFEKGDEFVITDVKLLAPCLPTKIVCAGLNYIDHAHELKMELPDEPVLFIKPSTSLIGPEENIIYPNDVGRLDFEAELAIVIKDKIRNVSKENAHKHILGYTCLNDVTARDIQRKDGQWTRSKSYDTFAPVGPCIVSGIDGDNLKIESFLNKEKRQGSNTKQFIFKTEYLVSFVSEVMTLYPGDIISTGTPSGVGSMTPGDIIEIHIEGIGTLKNYVK